MSTPLFAVIEHFNGFSLRHLPSGEEHWLSDGVDVIFDAEGNALSPGDPEMIERWTEIFNVMPSETLEAYFPQFMDQDENAVTDS